MLSTFWFGSWLLPFLLVRILAVLHHVPWLPVQKIPAAVLAFFLHPGLILGLLWLAYYLVTALWYGAESYERSQDISSNYVPALAHAWPGERKWELVKQCYHTYNEALKRYTPLPLHLQTPTAFFYRKGNALDWKGFRPILPEELLVPEHIHRLLPLLARHLAWYNTLDAEQRIMLQWYPDRCPWWLIITGNVLWLPAMIKRRNAWERWLAKHELEADTFAFWLGQGRTLEYQLRSLHEEMEKRGEKDTSVPPLVERIGHLEALNAQERKDMQAPGCGSPPEDQRVVTEQNKSDGLQPV